jgi:hypothetical protein
MTNEEFREVLEYYKHKQDIESTLKLFKDKDYVRAWIEKYKDTVSLNNEVIS